MCVCVCEERGREGDSTTRGLVSQDKELGLTRVELKTVCLCHTRVVCLLRHDKEKRQIVGTPLCECGWVSVCEKRERGGDRESKPPSGAAVQQRGTTQ